MKKPADNSGNWHGWEIDPPGPATWISKPWRHTVSGILTAFLKSIFSIIYLDSNGVQQKTDADVVITNGGLTATFDLTGLGGSGSGGSNCPWQSPKELDPTKSVPKNTFVYVSPQNPIATVGLVDLSSSGATLQATPGIWQAIQTVPAKTSSGYNVPQDPVPGSGGTGDLDSTGVFWVLWKSTC